MAWLALPGDRADALGEGGATLLMTFPPLWALLMAGDGKPRLDKRSEWNLGGGGLQLFCSARSHGVRKSPSTSSTVW